MTRLAALLVLVAACVGSAALVHATPASAATLFSYAGASGYAYISDVDNSGATRHVTISEGLCKDTTALGRLIEYKVDFGSTVRSDWKGGVSRGLNAGCSYGSSKDTFYFPNKARGVWARICTDVPGPVNSCGTSIYLGI